MARQRDTQDPPTPTPDDQADKQVDQPAGDEQAEQPNTTPGASVTGADTPDPVGTGEAADQQETADRMRIQQLEAELDALRGAPGRTELAWIVTYPTGISIQPKDAAGQPAGEPVFFPQGATLTPETVWHSAFLRSIGHVTALQVRVTS